MTAQPPAGRRVVVSGIGVVCPLGDDLAAVSAALQAGTSGLSLQRWAIGDEEVATTAGAAQPPADLDDRQRRRLDPFAQYALAAAKRAWRDAAKPPAPAMRRGVFFGTGFGGISTLTAAVRNLDARGPRRVSPLFVPAVIPNAAAGHMAQAVGATGPCLTVANACAAGANAIGQGFHAVQSGIVDVAICGGSEAPLDPLAVAGFRNMRALASDSCRPFAADRDGFLLGEGAAVLILEELEHARRRRVRLYGEVLGYAATADAHHITEPDPSGRGAESAMRRALSLAGRRAEDLDYINAHATGTPVGDQVEAAAIARVLGEAAERTWVSSTKGLTGHLLGGAGAVEAVITLSALTTGLLPPNLPFSPPGDDCALRLVTEPGRQEPVRLALSNSFGFGGVNAALLFGAADLGVE